MRPSRYVRIAEYLHMRGWPLPVDLQTHLLQEGVDPSQFE